MGRGQVSSPLRIRAVADGDTARNDQLSDPPAALITLGTPDAATEYRLGYRKFRVITRYNRCSLYAATMMDMASVLKEASGLKAAYDLRLWRALPVTGKKSIK